MEEEKKEDASPSPPDPADTMYTLAPEVPSVAAQELIQATKEKLQETTIEERKQQLLYQAVARQSYTTKTRKVSARAAISLLDHRDEIFGLFERILLVTIPWLIQDRNWLAAIIFVVVAGLAWLIKIQKETPGPIVAFFKQDVRTMRAQLADLSRTIYQ